MSEVFIGSARRLPLNAISKSALECGIEEAALNAFLITETGGKVPFRADGRMDILCEAHIVYRLNGGIAVPGLSVPKWDRTLYASTLTGEYDRLRAMIKHPQIGETIALQATSWGMGQVLGQNFKLCGYKTVQDFVHALADDAEAHITAVTSFLKARNILEPLRKKDWATVARLYNGTAYRENRYDEKLAANYVKACGGVSDPRLTIGDVGPLVSQMQTALVKRGFKITVDGDFGRRSVLALEQFQANNNLPVTGWLDPATEGALFAG